MVAQLSPDVLVTVNSALAGVTFFGGMACLAIWLYNHSLHAFRWAAFLALTMTATLLCSVAVFALPNTRSIEGAVFVRSTLYGCCVLLGVQAARHIIPGLPVRWISRGLLALLVVRTLLWWPTDLFIDHDAAVSRWPHYGPLFWTIGLFNVGVIATGVLAYRRSPGRVRPVIIACGIAIAALTIAPMATSDRVELEEMLTLNVVPGGIAILVLAGRTLLRTARGHDTLIRRQEVLLRLGQVAVAEPIDTLRKRVERELRTELGRDVVVAVSGFDRFPQPGTSGGTIRVSGRRQRAVVRGVGSTHVATRQFVEAALGILLAASERALSDADHAHAAGHDHLTGLLNLPALTDRLADRVRDDGGTKVVLLLCRLDGLGRLSAVEGPGRVESVLSATAGVLRGLRRSRTMLARISADTFGVAEAIAPADVESFLAARLCELRAAVSGAVPAVTLSIGAVVAGPTATAASLLADAAVALDHAPLGGDALFDDAVGADVRAKATLERDLARAVERDEIEVHYQPVATANGRTIVAYEGLARWRRHGQVSPPGVWVPAAERLGLIGDIDRRVLTIAARDQARLGVPVAVNVSPLDLTRESFAADVLTAIGDCPPKHVILEMTESAMMADLARSVAVLQELRAYGLRIALDDFGSSYSSLAALADLPVDILKLDASFVARLDQTNGVAVVQAVIGLGRSLGKPIVAEGVETEAQLSLLAMLGVDRVQGYLIGRPAAIDPLAENLVAPDPESQARRRLFVVRPVAQVR